MKFCENCGSELEEQSKFCEECGTSVETMSVHEEKEKEQVSEQAIPVAQKVDRKPLTKLQKIIGLSAVSAGILLFAGYHIGSAVYSEENQKSQMIEALVSKDADGLAKVIRTNDPNFEVTSESLESFVAYLDENPNYLNQLVNGLNNYGEYDSFYIGQNGSRLGIYDGYDLYMVPVYASVYTNYEGTVISANGEEWATSTSDDFTREIGPLAPGIHQFAAEVNLNGYTLETSEVVSWINSDYYNEVDLLLYGLNFYVESDLKEATVFLNDNEIGTLTDGSADFGPIQWQEGMELYVSQTFGEDEVRSESVELMDYDDYYYFNNLTLADEYELESVLSYMYDEVASLSRWYDEDYIEDLNSYFDAEGPAYELQRPQFITYAKTAYDDESVNSTWFDLTLTDYEQVSAKAFEVEYEVTYTTSYSYNSDLSDRMRHFSKEATIYFEPTNNPYRDYDVLIHEIRNETLLYEEGGN